MTDALRLLPDDLAAVIQEAMEASLRATVPEDRAERADRLVRAYAVLDQLPRWLRKNPRHALVPRVTPLLLRTVDAWTWGAGGILLSGPSGAGKSTAAALLVRRLVRAGHDAGGREWLRASRIRWWYAPDLALARRKNALGKGEAEAVTEAMNASLLVLDDAGLEDDLSVTRDVLNARYEAGAPTVATSGFSPEELSRRYSPALLRRITESGGTQGTMVEVGMRCPPDGKSAAAGDA